MQYAYRQPEGESAVSEPQISTYHLLPLTDCKSINGIIIYGKLIKDKEKEREGKRVVSDAFCSTESYRQIRVFIFSVK